MSLAHALPALGYAYEALEPHIDARTMEIHHTKHHQTYINNYLKLLEGTDWVAKFSPEEILMNIQELPENIRTGVSNNVGGHLNHAFFWNILTPGSLRNPQGALAAAIDQKFGSLTSFQEQFRTQALGVFGSGWAWLAKDASGQLVLTSTTGQGSVLTQGLTPLIGLDVWEHAYYLNYQNRRADYITAFWQVLNWQVVGDLYVA